MKLDFRVSDLGLQLNSAEFDELMLTFSKMIGFRKNTPLVLIADIDNKDMGKICYNFTKLAIASNSQKRDVTVNGNPILKFNFKPVDVTYFTSRSYVSSTQGTIYLLDVSLTSSGRKYSLKLLLNHKIDKCVKNSKTWLNNIIRVSNLFYSKIKKIGVALLLVIGLWALIVEDSPKIIIHDIYRTVVR